MPEERRRDERLHARFQASYQGDPGSSPCASLTRNISISGLCLGTRDRIPAGTHLLVNVQFPIRKRPLTAFAEVSWSSAARYPRTEEGSWRFESGLRFLELSESEQEFIRGHVVWDAPLRIPSEDADA